MSYTKDHLENMSSHFNTKQENVGPQYNNRENKFEMRLHWKLNVTSIQRVKIKCAYKCIFARQREEVKVNKATVYIASQTFSRKIILYTLLLAVASQEINERLVFNLSSLFKELHFR